jgi:hypothetical protein
MSSVGLVNLDTDNFLDLSMPDYPFALSHNTNVRIIINIVSRGPVDNIIFAVKQKGQTYFNRTTALNIICACRLVTFIVSG